MKHYTEKILEKLHIINKVLEGIGKPHILENNDFIVDDMSMESWLVIHLKEKNENKIFLSLTIDSSELIISLDRVSELIDWSDKNLGENNSDVQLILRNILTSHILVEYFGSSYTRIRLFGQDGKCINKFNYYKGISLNRKKDAKLYSPIYSIIERSI